MTPLKVYGLQRTGTNWLEELLCKNYEVQLYKSAAAGWKHGMYCADKMLGFEVNLLLLVKHPYSWLPSIWRYRGKKVDPSFNRYIQQSSEIELWNLMYRHWLSIELKTQKMFLIRYESLLQYPEELLFVAQTLFGMKRKEGDFYIPLGKMTTGSTESEHPFKDREHYLGGDYMEGYTDEALQVINKRIDWDLVSHLGFAQKEPVDAVSC